MRPDVHRLLCARLDYYRGRFEILIEILCHDDTKKYFPAYVKKKNGVNGLIDYFVNGTPDVGFTKQVIEKYMTNEKYDEIRDFNVFTDEYSKACLLYTSPSPRD